MPTRFIYYDTETTGIRAEKDYIIEIAAYDAEQDRTYSSFVNPGCPIPAEATAIHHITDDMVASAPAFDVVGQEFADFCSGDVTLIAHNNDSFDIRFLKAEYARHGKELPSHFKFLDSLKWARKYRPDLPRHALQFLREVYGLEANQAHRALDDVVMLHKIFSLMIGDLTPDTVCELMRSMPALTAMPFGKHQGKPFSEVPANYVKWLNKTGAFDKEENLPLKEKFQELGLITA